jgi:hypothetical protein
VPTGKQIREQARQQGFEQGRQQVLLRLLRERFGAEVDANVDRRVATASSEQFETWIDRVLAAATLTELLAD